MELIKKWLSGKKNFHVGVVLYDQFGTDKKLKQLFESGPDEHKQNRLERELTKLLAKPPELLQTRAQKPGDSHEMPKSHNPVLEALRNEWNTPYQRMQYLRHELDKYVGNTPQSIALRHPIAKEILELEQICMRVWSRRDYYLVHGDLPEVKIDDVPMPTDPVLLGRMIQNIERNIRRNKKLIIDHPTNVEYPLRLKMYEDRLEGIMKTIKNETPGK